MPIWNRPTSFHRGKLVRVRSESEIAATLDAHGKFEGMAFMPEMARYCGRTFRIYRRAVKTCVEGHSIRRLYATVLLEGLRCDGASHDGCQRNCLLFWKEAWLEPVDSTDGVPDEPHPIRDQPPLSEWALRLPTRVDDRYTCQSTELLGATEHLSRWNVSHLIAELFAGELTVWNLIRITLDTLLDRLGRALGLGRKGVLSGAQKAPSRGELDLQPGEWVEVKPPHEIRQTLGPDGKNRGLSFEPDMVDFAGKRFEVDFPVRKIILEQTGKMIPLEHTVALKGVACDGSCTKNCPRNNTLYWREIWLRRVERTAK